MSVKFLSLLFAITLCITSCSSSRSELHVYNWTYYIPEEILKAFEKETKIRLVYDVYTTNEEMYAKLKAGGDGYDVVSLPVITSQFSNPKTCFPRSITRFSRI
ncbi:MAG TPA: hypothetical protein PLD82_09265 [Spirochaetota bacterium]|nr:hypothetical protein [Spirochaetota bacterium]